MLSDRKKISIRQAGLIFLTIIITPAVRVVPIFTARYAKQSAWLAPIVMACMMVLLVLAWHRLYKKYPDSSLMDIYGAISGNFAGRIFTAVHLIWMVLLTALYIRYFATRLVGSIFPNTNMSFFLGSMLVLVAYTLRFGLQTLARLNEIILPGLMLAFIVLFLMLIPDIDIGFLTPVTYRSIAPVGKAGVAISGITAYYTFTFIIGDRINNKESLKRVGFQAVAILFTGFICLIVMTVGTFSHTVAWRTQLPFLAAVKQISLFNTLEKIESVVIALWIASDFVLLCFFTILVLQLMKSLFRFSDETPLINILMVFVYFLSMYLVNNVFELETLSNSFIIPGNIALGFVLPWLMLLIGKIRGKI